MNATPITRDVEDFEVEYDSRTDVTRIFLDDDYIVLKGKWAHDEAALFMVGWRDGLARGTKLGNSQKLIEIKNAARLLRDIIGL